MTNYVIAEQPLLMMMMFTVTGSVSLIVEQKGQIWTTMCKICHCRPGGVRGCGGSLWQGSERFLYHCSSSVCSLAFIVWPSLLSVKRHCMHLFCTRQWILSQLERRLKRGNDQKQRKEATSAQNSLERRYNLWLSVWFLSIPREKQICQRIFVKVILSESAL